MCAYDTLTLTSLFSSCLLQQIDQGNPYLPYVGDDYTILQLKTTVFLLLFSSLSTSLYTPSVFHCIK